MASPARHLAPLAAILLAGALRAEPVDPPECPVDSAPSTVQVDLPPIHAQTVQDKRPALAALAEVLRCGGPVVVQDAEGLPVSGSPGPTPVTVRPAWPSCAPARRAWASPPTPAVCAPSCAPTRSHSKRPGAARSPARPGSSGAPPAPETSARPTVESSTASVGGAFVLVVNGAEGDVAHVRFEVQGRAIDLGRIRPGSQAQVPPRVAEVLEAAPSITPDTDLDSGS